MPLLSIGCCGYLVYQLPAGTYLLFGGWLLLALAVYLLYSRHHSRLGADQGRERAP
ncbi:amino acid permease C-terminal domain-containing protein [Crossiella sp. SN42]|uniref:amino acid permease C-terminal domain-containing protein n=1 Tax=Crossiella sp. SN42 TaxID=2944808 RepID=UPI0027E0409F|nr:amino acid permease C-terminal domain-containing protein [Crossiella sp. SN42]